MRTEAKSIPSLKNKLIHINQEIDALYERYQGYDAFPPLDNLEKMTVILEDRRYFNHCGIDSRSVIREVWRAATFRRHGGASTIEMQFIRTVNCRRELTMYRKYREGLLALLANFHFNKIALLRSYLDIAFFGSGLIGRHRASRAMFGKEVYNLLPKEAAIIASMLVYPKPLKESDVWRKKIERRSDYAIHLLPRFEKGFEEVNMS